MGCTCGSANPKLRRRTASTKGFGASAVAREGGSPDLQETDGHTIGRPARFGAECTLGIRASIEVGPPRTVLKPLRMDVESGLQRSHPYEAHSHDSRSSSFACSSPLPLFSPPSRT
jgi:hypothetical protein